MPVINLNSLIFLMSGRKLEEDPAGASEKREDIVKKLESLRANGNSLASLSASGGKGPFADCAWHHALTKEELLTIPGREQQRQSCMFEIYRSELQYAADLRMLMDFRKRIADSPSGRSIALEIGDDFLETAFKNTQTLLDISTRLALLLSTIQDFEYPRVVTIMGPLHSIITSASFFKAYVEYATNFPAAKYAVDEGARVNDVFRAIIEFLLTLAESRHLNIAGHIFRPVGRFLRYRLLIEELLKHTREDHEDHKLGGETIAVLDRLYKESEAGVTVVSQKVEYLKEISNLSMVSGSQLPAGVPFKAFSLSWELTPPPQLDPEGKIITFCDATISSPWSGKVHLSLSDKFLYISVPPSSGETETAQRSRQLQHQPIAVAGIEKIRRALVFFNYRLSFKTNLGSERVRFSFSFPDRDVRDSWIEKLLAVVLNYQSRPPQVKVHSFNYNNQPGARVLSSVSFRSAGRHALVLGCEEGILLAVYNPKLIGTGVVSWVHISAARVEQMQVHSDIILALCGKEINLFKCRELRRAHDDSVLAQPSGSLTGDDLTPVDFFTTGETTLLGSVVVAAATTSDIYYESGSACTTLRLFRASSTDSSVGPFKLLQTITFKRVAIVPHSLTLISGDNVDSIAALAVVKESESIVILLATFSKP
ncbi:hypothetical protein DXG01_008661, partial [Tephrocybe rancida]